MLAGWVWEAGLVSALWMSRAGNTAPCTPINPSSSPRLRQPCSKPLPCVSAVAGSDSPRTPSGSTHSNALSESRSSLGSERRGGPSATESCQNDLLAEEYDSDASRSARGE